MANGTTLVLRNGEPAPVGAVPTCDVAAFTAKIVDRVDAGGHLVALFGHAHGDAGVRLLAVVGDDGDGTLAVVATHVGAAYPALTPRCPQAHRFECEIAEQCGVDPVGHPWSKPVRAMEPSAGAAFFEVRGDEIHEVAVGPVHAGIIEPGHFRFQCRGEIVLHLEIALGYQHRGVERALVGGPTKRTIHYMETLAGDTSIGHATAHCQAVEGLAGCRVPPRAEVLRGVALELERIANHAGDLGALAGDVGYLPTAAYCGRIRGDFLNMTALLCGSRFGRGLVRPGGVGFDVDRARADELLARLEAAVADVGEAVRLLWDEPSVQARFEDVGTLLPETSEALGLVGVAARASGLARDVRDGFPSGIFRFAHIPVSTWNTGDVFARAYVRWLEIQRSAAFVKEQLTALPDGPIRVPVGALAGDAMVASLVEGWRGEICHVALTDAQGRFARYKVVDPSFHNWMGLAMALRDQQISDFPLCNKSFNLSYCGHDL
jgi:Ni,Fe-hydrogenase III large subunit